MICTHEDQYVLDYMEGNVRWVVKLDDGTNVYDDDNRPGTKLSSWVRLKEYCKQNNRHIVDMYIQFRSHYKSVPSNKDGYFFKRSLRANFGGRTEYFILIGYKENNELHVTKWSTPELIHYGNHVRPIEPLITIEKQNV